MLSDRGKYTNSIGREFTFGPGTGVYVDKHGLANYKWTVKSVSNRISSLTRTVRDIPIDLLFAKCDPETRNRFIEIVEHDARTDRCGKLEFNGWTLDGVFSASSPSDYGIGRKVMRRSMVFTAQSKMWYRGTQIDFMPSEAVAAAGKSYPHGYAYDYAPTIVTSSIEVPGTLPAAWKMVVFGPATNPAVTIAGRTRRVNVEVESGGYLVVDAVRKTVLLVGPQGDFTNVFSRQDTSSYLFEGIPAGVSPVTWDNSFGWSIDLIEERSEPPWI